jgi:hypothetical protein
MTYQELIEQTKKFQAEALEIAVLTNDQVYRRASKLADDLGEFAEAIDHCRIAATR